MNAKMKDCFTPHAMIHSLTGLGVGLLLAGLFSSLASPMLGLIVIVVGIVLDMMRK